MIRPLLLILGCCTALSSLAQTQLEEIVVTAGFRDTAMMKSAGSMSVIDDQTIHDRAARHFDETINTLANVNYSAGGARARFVQVRGVGDLEQFVDPKHFPSVGITVDGIDIGTTATGAVLMDVDQIEVLRGPQGTEFGANALAGLINIRTRAPSEAWEGSINAGYGSFDSWNIGATVSGPLSDSLGGRLAFQHQESDGYYDNTFLDTDRTNKREELNLNGKLHWQGDNGGTMSVIGRYSDIDSGYDAFSLDNVRTTLADNPGTDAQESAALALKGSWPVFNNASLDASLSWHQQDEDYSFDEDWVFAGFCNSMNCDPLFEFSNTDMLFRKRDTYAFDVRLKSDPGDISWIVGVYGQHRDEDLTRFYYGTFTSQYETDRIAVYGQFGFNLSDELNITAGLRYEDFEDDYNDSNALDTRSSDDYWSGHVSAEYNWDDNTLIYATLARSVKPGGVNTETSSSFPFITPVFQPFLLDRRLFAAETLLNKEVGLKSRYLDNRLSVRLALFHMDRDNAQLESFVWDANTFIFTGFLDSTSDAENYGVELELDYQLSTAIDLFANVGYLETEVDTLNVFDLDLNQFVRRDGRDQAKAPKWQYNLGADFSVSEQINGRIEVEGRDESFFGYYHNGQIDGYALVHASMTWRQDSYSIQAWARNILDEDHHIHGLYFANDPRDVYAVNRSYYQFGEPRAIGVNFGYSF